MREVEEASNNQIGQAWTIYALGELAEAWPVRVSFNALDMKDKTGVGPRRDPEEVFDHLFEWLRDTGFIKFQQATEGNVFDVSLTERGLDSIGRSLSLEKPNIGAALKKIASDTASETGRVVIAETVGLLIGGIVRSLSGGGAS